MELDSTVSRIARGLVAEDPSVRQRSADEVTDILRGLDPGQVDILAHLLVSVRVTEADPMAGEAQLHALAELGDWYELPRGVLSSLAHIPPETLTHSQPECVDCLLQVETCRTVDHPEVPLGNPGAAGSSRHAR